MTSESHPARGRPRRFNIDEALIVAARLFWEKGYEQTSLDELTAAMNIQRGSFYAAFRSKEALFARVLDLYAAEKEAYMREALDQPTARGVVACLLSRNRGLVVRGGAPTGIMNLVHGMNLAALDSTLAAHVQERADHWRDRLVARMERAQREGDFGPQHDARALALLVKASTEGLLAVARHGGSNEDLKKIDDALLAVWPGR